MTSACTAIALLLVVFASERSGDGQRRAGEEAGLLLISLPGRRLLGRNLQAKSVDLATSITSANTAQHRTSLPNFI